MKKFYNSILIFTLLLSFSGCFSFEDDKNNLLDEGFISYKTENFSINIPEKWEVITKNEFTSDIPEETIAVFRNNVKNETFTANINIVAKSIQEEINSLEFAKMVINRQSSGLIGYEESKKESFNIKVNNKEEETFLNKFEAKKTPNDINIKYVQVYAVKDNIGYIVTGAVSTKESESILQIVEKIVKSFTL